MLRGFRFGSWLLGWASRVLRVYRFWVAVLGLRAQDSSVFFKLAGWRAGVGHVEVVES